MNRIPSALAWLTLAGLWAVSVVYFDRLPDQIPMHFGTGGTADAWAPTSLVRWYAMPALATALSLSMMVLAWWTASHPERINLPGKERIAGLPPERLGPVRGVIHELFAILQLEVVVLMSLAQRATWVAATGGDTKGILAAVLVIALLSSPVLLAWITLRMQRAVDLAAKGARSEGGALAPRRTD